MSYKLYIKDAAATWQLLDMGNEKPAMNYQVNNITELKDMQTDYSQALVLPYSSNNCRHFGFSNEFDIDSSVRYMKFECRLFYRESIIAGKGSYLYVDRMSDSGFHTQILSGNIDLFETLKLRKMSELDLGYYLFGTNDFGFQTSDYILARANFIKGDNNWSDSVIDKKIPFAWLKNAVEKILSGYDLVTNLQDLDWETKAININSLSPSNQSLTPFRCKFENDDINISHDSILGIVSETISASVVNSGNGNLTTGLIYTAPCDMSVRIQGNVFVNFSGSGSGQCNLLIQKLSDQSEVDIINAEATNENNVVYDQTFDLLAGEQISWVLNAVFYPNDYSDFWWTLTGSWFNEMTECLPISTTVITLGALLPISQNLGFDTQYDFFKMFVQLYGMTVIVDNEAKKVYCFTSKKLIDNKQIAIDWSGKLHIAEFEHRHSLEGYAKVNFINFEKYQDDFATIEDKGYFEIADERLSPEKTLFTIGIESGENYSQKFLFAPLTVAKIPLWKREFDEETQTPLFRFEAGKPHIVEITQASSTYYATHVSMQEFISMYYSDFVQMLNGCKVIERSFNLSEEDIELYKSFQNNMPGMFIPVYISHFGRFFYINKIKNFVSGKLTRCELIKL